MSLVRAWMRQLSGASAATLLVPGAIFTAMVLLALTGAFSALGGLGQALSGPRSSSETRAASALLGSGASARAAVPLRAALAAGTGRLVASTQGVVRGGGSAGAAANGATSALGSAASGMTSGAGQLVSGITSR